MEASSSMFKPSMNCNAAATKVAQLLAHVLIHLTSHPTCQSSRDPCASLHSMAPSDVARHPCWSPDAPRPSHCENARGSAVSDEARWRTQQFPRFSGAFWRAKQRDTAMARWWDWRSEVYVQVTARCTSCLLQRSYWSSCHFLPLPPGATQGEHAEVNNGRSSPTLCLGWDRPPFSTNNSCLEAFVVTVDKYNPPSSCGDVKPFWIRAIL